MFKIRIKDLGIHRVTKDVTAYVGTWREAESYALMQCRNIIPVMGIYMRRLGKNNYGVCFKGSIVGWFRITRLRKRRG